MLVSYKQTHEPTFEARDHTEKERGQGRERPGGGGGGGGALLRWTSSLKHEEACNVQGHAITAAARADLLHSSSMNAGQIHLVVDIWLDGVRGSWKSEESIMHAQITRTHEESKMM